MEFKNELPDNILDDHNADISNNDPDDIHGEVPVNTMADLSEYIGGIQRAEEIRVSIEKSTAERAATVQEMMREKEKPPSLIKSIIERLNGN